MRKRVISFILIVAIVLTSFAGCGNSERQEDNALKEIVPTGELAPVANFFDVNLPFYDINIDFVWQGDDFVYMEKEWDKDARRNICTLSRVPADGSDEAVQIYQTTAEEPSIWNFTMDDAGNFYTQSWVPIMDSDPLVKEFTMCKYDANMQEILCVEPNSEQLSFSELNAADYMYADEAGHVVLADYECNVYFFDENLNFIWKEKLPNNFTEANFIDAGEQGSFFAEYDYMTCRVSLLKIEYDKQRLVAMPDINMSNYLEEYDTLKVVSGKEYGILLSGEEAMWKYNVDTGEVEEWFDWKDSNMNVYGDTIEEVRFHEEVEGEPFMSVWCYDSFTRGNSEIAEISYIDKAYLPEKQTVVLGTLWEVGDWVSKFNRNSREYEVIVKTYENEDEMVQSFLFGQDEIPDILDISVTSSAMLENKGILEDLEPYFKKSDAVNKDDILEQIWDMCKTDGKVTSMMTCFYFQSCVTTAESISEDGWTIDEFFSLEEQYSESKPLLYYTYRTVFNTLGDMGVENFIDWEKNKSDFDSKEFIDLIERIKGLNVENSEPIYLDEQEEINSLLTKDYLLRCDYYNSPYWYRRVQKKYRGNIKNVGFPTTDGEPYYRVYPTLQFSIYSGSEKKDGAWAFIEYMLSEETQTWYGDDVWAFPVRQEAFEAFLTKPHSAVINYADDDESIDTYTVFINMIEHSHLRSNNSLGIISTIVNEELQAYFKNEKSAEDTAQIIQSRVQLYLDENY